MYQQNIFEVGGVTSNDIRAYLDLQVHEQGICNATKARKLTAIRLFFNYLVESGQIEASPAASIKSPKITERA